MPVKFLRKNKLNYSLLVSKHIMFESGSIYVYGLWSYGRGWTPPGHYPVHWASSTHPPIWCFWDSDVFGSHILECKHHGRRNTLCGIWEQGDVEVQWGEWCPSWPWVARESGGKRCHSSGTRAEENWLTWGNETSWYFTATRKKRFPNSFSENHCFSGKWKMHTKLFTLRTMPQTEHILCAQCSRL